MSAGRLQEKLERRKSVFLDDGIKAVRNTAHEYHLLGMSRFNIREPLMEKHSAFFKALMPSAQIELADEIISQEWGL